MAAALTASFILKLEDKLSSGIAALSKRLEALAALSQKLKFEGLQQAGGAFDKVSAAADTASRKVEGIGRSARSAVAELRRLSSQPIMINTGGTAFLPPGASRAAMAAVIAAAAAGGGAGGRVPAIRDASFFGGAGPLLLGGPQSGGIPLELNRASAGWSNLRSQLGQTAVEARRVGQELGHAGHAALTAGAAGFGLYHTIHSAAELDAKLRQVAIIEGKSGAGAQAEVDRLRGLLGEDSQATGQNVVGLAEAYRDLVSRGLHPEVVDKLIGIHSRAATAYEVDPNSMGQAVYALNKTLGIGEGDMEGALAAMMQGTHAGSFSMQALSRYLPQVAGQMNSLGWTGRGSLDSVVSMLEVVSQQSGTPEETATNFKDMLQALTGKYTVKSFKHLGIDLPAEMDKARKAGKNPVDSYLDILEGLIKGIDDPLAQAYKLGNVLHNQQAGSATRAILQNRKEQRELAEQLHNIGADKLTKDFGTAMAGLEPQLRRLSAEWALFEMRLGVGFAPLVRPAIGALHALNAALEWMDRVFPGVLTTVLAAGGGFVTMATGIGVLLPLFRAMQAGAMVLLSPIRLLITAVMALGRAMLAFVVEGGPIVWALAAIAAAAYLIYRNWDTLGPYFRQLWADLKIIFGAFWTWLSGWVGPTMTAIVDALKAAWNGLKTFFDQLWAYITAPFDHFMDRLRRGIDEMRGMLGGGSAATDGKLGDGRRDKDATDPDGKPALGGIPGFRQQLQDAPYTPMSYRGGPVTFAPLEIKVTTDGNARVQAPERIRPVDRGPMLDRA